MALSIRAKTYGLSGVVCLFLVGSGLLSTQTLGELANDAELRDRARLQESTLYEINLLLAREVAGESARPALLEKLHRFEVASAELRDLIGPSTNEVSKIHTAFERSGQSWAAYAGGVADTLEQLDSRVASFEAVTRGLSPLLAKLSSVERAFKKADEDEYEYHIETAQDARAGFGELRNTLYKLVALPFGDELNQTDLAVRLTCERHLEEALALLNGSDDLELEPVEDDALIPQLQAMHKLATDMGGNVITLVEAKLALERERDALGAKLDGTALSLREVGAAAADSSRASQAQFRTMLAGIAITSALLLAFLLKISRGVLAGLQRANTVADGITSGDLNQEIPLTREDEIGHLFLAMNGMQDGLRSSKQQADRAREVEVQRSLDLEKLHQQQVIQAGELQESLADSRALAEKDAKRNQMESERAAELGGLANSSLTAAVEGSTIVESAVASMAKINESSNLIAAIVSTIDDIAFQTNLLALNASVEAERAGDAGRGFAVVAGEVSSLATRSAQSAKQISELIEESILRVEIGSKQVNASGNNLNAIVASVREVSLFIEELAKTP